MAKSTLVTKTKVVPFINFGKNGDQDWRQIKKSIAFDLAMNPQTKTYDFISSENPEEEIVGYQPSLAQSITMFKGEDDYQVFFDMLFERPTAADAHKEVLIAFYQEKGETASDQKTVFKAWRVDALVKLNQMSTVNESIDVDLSLNVIIEGAVSLESGKPIFTEGTWDGAIFTESL